MARISLTTCSAVIAVALSSSGTLADPNLRPNYQPMRPQTDSERLQNFRPPPPPLQTYPAIRGGEVGDPRLYVNPNVSVGGSPSGSSVEGNVRFPIPGR
jgi:hypothetical protein